MNTMLMTQQALNDLMELYPITLISETSKVIHFEHNEYNHIQIIFQKYYNNPKIKGDGYGVYLLLRDTSLDQPHQKQYFTKVRINGETWLYSDRNDYLEFAMKMVENYV